ncbi:MAG: hypothetical protein ACPGN3_08805 [Opitutales bacterium]
MEEISIEKLMATPKTFTMRLLPLFVAALIASQIASAARPIDVTQRNSVFPNRKYDKSTIPLKENKGLADQRFQKKDWQGEKMSRVGDQRAPIQMNGTFDKDIKEFPSFRRDDARISMDDRAYGVDGREARLEKWNERWDKDTAWKFDVEPIPGALMGLNEYYLLSEQISMQDINRYQFRRSHSSDEGLEKVRAGSKE